MQETPWLDWIEEAQLKVLVTGMGDVENVLTWSGTPYHILRGLRKKLGTANVVSKSIVRPTKLAVVDMAKYGYSRMLGRRYTRDFTPATLVSNARQLEEAVAAYRPSVVLSLGSQPISMAHLSVPVIMWSDATFSAMVHMNPVYDRLSDWGKSQGERAERMAIDKVTVAVFSSAWAARSAVDDYCKDARFVRVVPFGANLPVEPSADRVITNIAGRGRESCDLLFVGVDWQGKRGDFAVEVTRQLTSLGIHTRLRVVGCSPTSYGAGDLGIEVLGRLRKDVTNELEQLEELYSRSHFLLVPSGAEAYGIVYAEASAFGLPSIATDVGGVATVVRPERNGLLFPRDASPREYAESIVLLWRNQDKYIHLCRTSREEYEQRLNWGVSIDRLCSILEEVCTA